MKVICIVWSLFLSTVTVNCQLTSQDIYPCSYQASSAIISCVGNLVNDSLMKTIGATINSKIWKGTFRILEIKLTSVTVIGKDTFPDMGFESIHIDSNDLLATIDANAFTTQSVRTLRIANNPHLTDARLFQLANNLNVYHELVLENNGITEITANALIPGNPESSATIVRLNHNKISSIGAQAFHNLPLLTQIYLHDNLLTQIADNAFHVSNEEKLVVIDLQRNHLTSKSFTAKAFAVSPNTLLSIHLQYNNFTDFPETLFKPLLNEDIIVYMRGNPLKCDCSGMKWIRESTRNIQVDGILCANHAEKDLLTLTNAELGC